MCSQVCQRHIPWATLIQSTSSHPTSLSVWERERESEWERERDACTHARTRERARAHTHTHTHTHFPVPAKALYKQFIFFPQSLDLNLARGALSVTNISLSRICTSIWCGCGWNNTLLTPNHEWLWVKSHWKHALQPHSYFTSFHNY